MIFAWVIVNAILSAGLAAILSYKLIIWGGSYNFVERLGMGLMGGSVILTIGPLLTSEPTPFDGWATALLRFGAILYFAARLYRLMKHRHANTKAKRDAVAHMEGGRSSQLEAAERTASAAVETASAAVRAVARAEKTVIEIESDQKVGDA